jgi:hypothetical protein
LPLLLSLIDERLSFSVQGLRLFDNRLGPIEKINQPLVAGNDFSISVSCASLRPER